MCTFSLCWAYLTKSKNNQNLTKNEIIQKQNRRCTSAICVEEFLKVSLKSIHSLRRRYGSCVTVGRRRTPDAGRRKTTDKVIPLCRPCYAGDTKMRLIVEGLMVTSRRRTTIKALFHCLILPCVCRDFVSCAFTPYPFIVYQ